MRRLYMLFAVSMVLTAIICMIVGYLILVPETRLIRLGSVSKFAGAGDAPVDVAVKQLGISTLIPNRPTLSEDVIFVVRDGEQLRAFLGTDPSSGCFLSWREERQVFADSCAQHTYGFTGRNTNQLATRASKPVNMVELPVTVRNNVLFAEDRILRRDIQ